MVASVILVVWAVAYLSAVFSHGKTSAPPEISGIMLVVVTWLFTSSALRELRKKNDDA